MSERELRNIMSAVSNARYTYNPSYDSECDYDYDDYDDIEHNFMTDEM